MAKSAKKNSNLKNRKKKKHPKTNFPTPKTNRG